jgi:hypothetical protein
MAHSPPGGWIQNWYSGLAQPVAVPLSPTFEPGD